MINNNTNACLPYLPHYLQLVQFQGLVRKNYTLCIHLLTELLPYKDILYTNKHVHTIFRCFVEVMDTDSCNLQLYIIQLLLQIVEGTHNLIIGPCGHSPVLIAAVAGHYKTVSCLLAFCDEKSLVDIVSYIHDVSLPIAMLVLRVAKPYLHNLNIVSLVGNCIANNNIHVLELLSTAYPSEYDILTGCDDCKTIIHDMKEYDMFLSNKYLVHDEALFYYTLVDCTTIEHMSTCISEYMNRFAPLNMYPQPDTLIFQASTPPIFICVHDWWLFVFSHISKRNETKIK